jgi:hypothetical protein
MKPEVEKLEADAIIAADLGPYLWKSKRRELQNDFIRMRDALRTLSDENEQTRKDLVKARQLIFDGQVSSSEIMLVVQGAIDRIDGVGE